MKKICLVLIMLLALVGCNSQTKEDNKTETKELPMTISQDDWADSKQFVELSTGIKMAYVEMGDPEGPVVILQHGMTDNSRSWSLAAPYFTAAGYHVYLPDLRGMGKTDATDGYYTTITYASDMEAFFDALGIEKAIVVGHSLGSFTVQTFALMFPERCEKVVLVSSIPIINYQSESLNYLYTNFISPLAEDGHPSDKFMDFWYNSEFKEDNGEEIEFDKFLNNLKTESQAISKNTWVNILLGLTATNLKDVYYRFDKNIPVLVLHGNDDGMTKLAQQEELCELLGVDENSYRNYMNVGHNIQFEITNQATNDILYWLDNGVLPQE